jgi:hypothetical protein
LADRLAETLPDLWRRAYRKMAQSPTNLRRFSDHGFELMFDHASQLVARGVLSEERMIEDRIVVAFGRSGNGVARHNGHGNGGLLGPCAQAFGGRFHSEHPMGRALGGGPDIGLFPLRRDVAREWSADGRAYRAMERYCAERPGTFCFSRPIYTDRSWIPQAIEYGLLRDDGRLWVRLVDNAAPAPRVALPLVRRLDPVQRGGHE